MSDPGMLFPGAALALYCAKHIMVGPVPPPALPFGVEEPVSRRRIVRQVGRRAALRLDHDDFAGGPIVDRVNRLAETHEAAHVLSDLEDAIARMDRLDQFPNR